MVCMYISLYVPFFFLFFFICSEDFFHFSFQLILKTFSQLPVTSQENLILEVYKGKEWPALTLVQNFDQALTVTFNKLSASTSFKVQICLFLFLLLFRFGKRETELFCCFYLVHLFLNEITVIISPGSAKRLMRLSLLNMV